MDCGESFTTYERVELSFLKVEKKSGRKEYYRRGKLFSGIYHAIAGGKKQDRGDAGELAEEILLDLEDQILKKKLKEISTSELQKLVFKTLLVRDWRSGLRYWAYFSKPEKDSLTKMMSFID